MGLTRQQLVLLSLSWYAVGVVVIVWVEGFHFITANYLIMQIVTTIGYGDMGISDRLHLFMIFYVLFGIAVVANVINEVCNYLMQRDMQKLRSSLRTLEAFMDSELGVGTTDAQLKKQFGRFNKLASASFIFVFFLLGGAVFYATVEACSCGHGDGAKEGCTPDNCHETGITKSFVESIYMAVVTMTTIGFGDFTPVSLQGRAFGFFWMLFSVMASGNFVDALSSYIRDSAADKKKKDTHEFSEEVFRAIDKDSNGVVNNAEFALWMLMKHGLVEIEDLNRFDRLYAAMDKLDRSHQGISIEELKKLYQQGKGDSIEAQLLSVRSVT